MAYSLMPHSFFERPRGPLVIVVMDGIGIGAGGVGDAVHQGKTPFLDLCGDGPGTSLLAHGRAVGLPTDGDMGNSEVGHNALGSGQIHDQGALLVNKALESGNLFAGEAWKEVVSRCKKHGSALHFLGLLSDGNVHSHQNHLFALLRRAASEGLRKLFVHILLDGRDVEPVSAEKYLAGLEAVLEELRGSGVDAQIASGGGRMEITMDRYQADWPMVERGYQTHVYGEGRQFPTATAALATFRKELPNVTDQNLPAFVIARGGVPVGPMGDGDCVVNFNFRGDRAIEISQALESSAFSSFHRKKHPDILYVGMMEYDGDLHVPKKYLVSPPEIRGTLGEYLVREGIHQIAVSETQKYGHVTFFWNGNRSGKIDDTLETYIEIPSDTVPFETAPAMKAAEITDALIRELHRHPCSVARVNYANGDMVGHTGDFAATVQAVQVVDREVQRLCREVERMNGVVLITADHGNAEEMIQLTQTGEAKMVGGRPAVKTSHTLNRVPFYVLDWRKSHYQIKDLPSAGISNVASTVLDLLGFKTPESWQESLLEPKP